VSYRGCPYKELAYARNRRPGAGNPGSGAHARRVPLSVKALQPGIHSLGRAFQLASDFRGRHPGRQHFLELALLHGGPASSCGSRSGHLLFLARRDCPGSHRRQVPRCWDAASKFCRFAITSPQFGASDRPNELAPRRALRLHLHQRFVADLGRCILRECICREADRGENEQNPHRHFPFAFSPRNAGRELTPFRETLCERNPTIS
jgi:hypothetical protein